VTFDAVYDVDRIVILVAADDCLSYLPIETISNLTNRRNITLLKKLPRIPAKRADRSNAFLATFSSEHLHPERFLKRLVLWATAWVPAFACLEHQILFSKAKVLIFIISLHSNYGWWNFISIQPRGRRRIFYDERYLPPDAVPMVRPVRNAALFEAFWSCGAVAVQSTDIRTTSQNKQKPPIAIFMSFIGLFLPPSNTCTPEEQRMK
jgi:hypothetical protein